MMFRKNQLKKFFCKQVALRFRQPGFFGSRVCAALGTALLGALLSAMIVPAAQAQASGTKLLYVYDNQTLTRIPQPATNTTGIVVAANGAQDWTMTPTVAAGKSLTLDAGEIVVSLSLACSGTYCGLFGGTSASVELLNGAASLGSSAAQTIVDTDLQSHEFTVDLAAPATIPAGGTLTLRVHNDGFFNGLSVAQYDSGVASTIAFDTSTVVNVDSVDIHSAAYPATATKAVYAQNDVVYIRAAISDPFGSADVSSAALALSDPDGIVQVNDAAMTLVDDSGVATRTFEYAYVVPANAELGFWTASVTGHEGTEDEVTHTADEVFSVGVSHLSLTKSHTDDFTAGGNGSFSLVVRNNGPPVAGTTTVTDTLPAALSYVSGTGTGWSCGATGQDVTCTSTAPIATDTDLPTLTLNVAVAAAPPASVDNIAAVSNPGVDGGIAQNSNIDTVTILRPDLSTSTKNVVDLNGGDAEPGDTLRYTITLVESGGGDASGVSVTDDIPASVTGFVVVSTPAGSIDSSTSDGGANGTGYLNVTGIDIPANGSVSIVFDLTVSGSASPGDTINNTADATNPGGPGATPAAPTVVVSQSQVAASGNKLLYVYDNQSLTRTPQPATPTAGIAVADTLDWTLTPTIAAGESLILDAGQIGVTLAMACSGGFCGFVATETFVELLNGAVSLGTSDPLTFQHTDFRSKGFTVDLAAPATIPAGGALTLRVHNTSGFVGLNVAQYGDDVASTIAFDTSTVVNVDSVDIYSDAYDAATTETYYVHGDMVYVRTAISDPFGSDDVSGATIDLVDTDGNVRVDDAAMTEVDDSGAASKTFEYAYIVPADAALGSWTASVTGHEGTEDTVTHTGNAPFEVRGQIALTKLWVDATAGDAVDLSITGGGDAVAGDSTAPDTTTDATATGTASATITLTEAFTTGSAGNYTVSLACVKDSDDSAVPVTGTGLSRSIEMPGDSSVTCTWTNTTTVPLTVVKRAVTHSDPINGTTNPKAIPGALVDYTVNISNPAPVEIDIDTVVISDPVPDSTELFVGDLGASGSGPVAFSDGSPGSGLTYTFTSLASTTDDVDFSSDGGSTWTYTPTPDGDGIDPAVTDLRINPKGAFNADNGEFTIVFRMRIQ